MRTLFLTITTVLCSVVCGTTDGLAQPISEGGILGTGSAVIERPAERMRMQVDMIAKSKGVADTVAKLKAQQTKAMKQLEALGAVKDSIKLGEARFDENQNDDQQQRMMMMMQQRMAQRRGKKPAEKEAPAKPVKITMRLTAEWSLKSKDAIDLLVEAKKLQDAIKAADLAGIKDGQDLTPEEAEVAEESEDPNMQFNGQQGPKPGEPAFIFVTVISAEDREKALVEAVNEAKLEATQLAKAAGVDLGSLRSLSSGNDMNDYSDDESYQNLYNSGFRNTLRRMMNGRNQSREAIGASPGKLKFQVTASVSFAIR